VRGTLRVRGSGASAEGTFEAVVCGDAPAGTTLPATAREGAVMGTRGDKAFAAKTALGVLMMGMLVEVRLFPGEASCGDIKTKKGEYLIIYPTGEVSQAALPGDVPIPARVSYRQDGVESTLTGGRFPEAWVRFETLAWKAGGRIKGTMAAAGTNKGVASAFDGTFTATLCE
jgi:hypothetical protein